MNKNLYMKGQTGTFEGKVFGNDFDVEARAFKIFEFLKRNISAELFYKLKKEFMEYKTVKEDLGIEFSISLTDCEFFMCKDGRMILRFPEGKLYELNELVKQ